MEKLPSQNISNFFTEMDLGQKSLKDTENTLVMIIRIVIGIFLKVSVVELGESHNSDLSITLSY